jgi:hypothetical protein
VSALLETLARGWTAFSIPATLAGAGGLGLIALAFLASAYLPAFLKRPLIAAGICLFAGAALFQAGEAKGARDAFAREASRAIAAETKRADLSEAINRSQAAQAAKDLEAERARNSKLKDILDAMARDKDAARVCVDRNIARRLRDL